MQAASKTCMLLGQCVPCLKTNASKFRIKRLELDKNILMYFKKEEFIFAHDPEKKCKTGDIVLLEQLPSRLTRLITHSVREIVYPLGDITDPLTGKKVVASVFREHTEILAEVYGKAANKFDYESAPPRGWQEGKKDFTHQETYRKYHEDNTEQPFGVKL